MTSTGISSGAAYSAAGEYARRGRSKIVQRMPMRVIFTAPLQLDKDPLRIDVSLDVRVDLHDESGPRLAREVPTKPAFTTHVYQHPLAHADERVAQFIRENMSGLAK